MKKIYFSLFIISLINFNVTGQNSNISSNSNLATSRINLDSEYAPIQSSSNLQNSNRAIWTIQLDADPTTIGTSLAGVIWTGTEFWCAKWNSADIYTADASGNLTGNFTISGITGARSFTTDSSHIYIGAAGGSIYKVDPATKTLVSTISTSVASCRYVTYDPTLNSNAGGFWTGAYASDITSVSMTGTTLSTISSAIHGLTGIYGMAYDNFSTGGPFLWAFDQGGNDADIIQLDMSGNPTGLMHDANSDLGAGGGLSGGLFICNNYFPGTTSIIGIVQGESLFSYELYAAYVNCISPYGFSFSNFTTNSVDLTWTGSANALSYNVEYGISGFSQGNGTFLNDTSNSYSFTGLLTSQEYEVYIQALCDSSDSSLWAGPISFSTLCIETAPYLENFDNSFPNCFSQTSNDLFDWTLNSGTTASTATGPTDDITGGGDYIYIEASAPRVPNDSAIVYSPFIDKSSLTNSKLTFYSHMYGTSIGTLRIDVSDDGGNSYTNIYSKSGDQADQWNFQTVSLDSFSDTIRFKISATVGDDGSGTQWFGDIAIDNFEVSEALEIDVAGVSLATSPTLALTNAPFTISGELNNRGINIVTSMDINYTINGGAAVTMPLTNLNFTTGSNYSFSHTSTWNPSGSGSYTVEIWASNINGANDMNLSNDRVSKSITVASNLALRRPMLESFTSSTCGPCAPGNVNVSSVLQGYQDNQYSILKYQVDFPGAGDPYYTDEVGDRRTYYSVNSVPDLVVDGNEWQDNSSSLTSQIVDNSISKPSFIDLSSTYSVGGQNVDFQVTIDPLGNFTNLTLYAAIFEYITFNNIGTNGETEFEYVMKKMVPGSSGLNLNSLQDGTQRVEDLSYTFNGNYILPTDANNPVNHAINHTVEDFNELGVIVWIQDDATKEILQSTTASLVTSVIENNSPASKLMIFPNPTSDLATLAFEGYKDSDIEINIVNLLGEVVFTKEINSSSYLDYYNLDVSRLSNGIYNVIVNSNGKVSTKKIQILR